MDVDWLFALPVGVGWEEQGRLVGEWLAADPAAAAIDAAEAEQFFAVAYFLRCMSPAMVKQTAQRMGLTGSGGIEKLRRRVALRMLRGWRKPKQRADLIFTVRNSTMAHHPFPAEHPEVWTDEYAAQAYHDGAHLMWLVMVRRCLGRADSLLEWLEGLSEYALTEYQLYLDVGRLTMRRIVYPEKAAAQVPATEQVAAAVQAVELQEKTKQSGILRQGVRRLEKERKALRRQVRQQERAAAEQLAQARGEVAAARRALQALEGALQRELAEQARRFEAQLAALREALTAERKAFAQAVGALRSVNILQGETVVAAGDPELSRLLVESVGGQCVAVPDPGAAPADLPAACLALEQHLRDLAFRHVHIRGDGLYRRKGARPGIAAAAFEVQLCGVTVAEVGEVVAASQVANNFMAEYGAIALALAWLDRAGAGPGTKAILWSDCKFVVNALHRPLTERCHPGCVRLGGKPVRGCSQLDTQVRRLMQRLRRRGCHIELRWVPREQVHVADRLCDRTYRDTTWYHRRQGIHLQPLQPFLERLGAAR